MPSFLMMGTMIRAATGSAHHHHPRTALRSRPVSRTTGRHRNRPVWQSCNTPVAFRDVHGLHGLFQPRPCLQHINWMVLTAKHKSSGRGHPRQMAGATGLEPARASGLTGKSFINCCPDFNLPFCFARTKRTESGLRKTDASQVVCCQSLGRRAN
jgi:hypothetical protein